MASDVDNQSKVYLGDEFDDSLRSKLMEVLRQLGALPHGDGDRFVAGSQDLEEIDMIIDGRRLHIAAETYVGLSISGPRDLLEQIRRLLG